jgi:hypothetical protein
MNLREIREECWSLAGEKGDYDDDKLWPMTDMNRYINRVYKHIARETLCIRDAITPEVCLISCPVVDYTTYVEGTIDYIWANDPTGWLYQKNVCQYRYALHPKIVQIDEAKWTNRTWKLTRVSVQKWQTNPWWEQVVGMPTEYATDLSNNTIALNFRSEEADTIRLQVRRLPLVDLIDDEDIPEIRESYHDFFLNGVLHNMYLKQDAEAFDGYKAAEYKQLYLADIDEIKQQESLLDRRLRPNHSLSAFR